MNFLYYDSSNEFDSISLALERGLVGCDFQLCGNIGSGAIGNEFDYQEARIFVPPSPAIPFRWLSNQ